MSYYVLIKADTSQFIGVSNEDATQLGLPGVSLYFVEGDIPDLNNCTWDGESLVRNSTLYTKLEFLNKFTLSERVAIRASSDAIVKDFMYLMEESSFVDVTNDLTVQAINYLASIALIDPSRVSEILS